MRPYLFLIGVLFMLAFSLTGLTAATAGVLRWLDLKPGRLVTFALACGALVVLIIVLGWSVPPRG